MVGSMHSFIYCPILSNQCLHEWLLILITNFIALSYCEAFVYPQVEQISHQDGKESKPGLEDEASEKEVAISAKVGMI